MPKTSSSPLSTSRHAPQTLTAAQAELPDDAAVELVVLRAVKMRLLSQQSEPAASYAMLIRMTRFLRRQLGLSISSSAAALGVDEAWIVDQQSEQFDLPPDAGGQ